MSRKLKILIADDELVSRKKLALLVKNSGHEVLLAENGSQAWGLWQEHRPGILFTDWDMPGMNGLELCANIREGMTDEYTFIIIVTAMEAKDCITGGMDAGADAYIIKPYDKNQIKFHISTGARMLQLHRQKVASKQLDAVLEMAGSICHEFNQPLQIISGFVELAVLEVAEGDPLHRNITAIKEQVDRMATITKKLMRITKYETRPYLSETIIDIDKASDTDEE